MQVMGSFRPAGLVGQEGVGVQVLGSSRPAGLVGQEGVGVQGWVVLGAGMCCLAN